ncbi:MAG TPA: hypothetical protein VF615_09835 [Longimicrobiaceae bacterium]|jgi:hypothetical protein
MARIARIPARLAYAAALLGSLAFGATQAFAAPATPSSSEARFCDEGFCDYFCGGLGHCTVGGCACY